MKEKGFAYCQVEEQVGLTRIRSKNCAKVKDENNAKSKKVMYSSLKGARTKRQKHRCILRSSADSDAFQSGCGAEYN